MAQASANEGGDKQEEQMQSEAATPPLDRALTWTDLDTWTDMDRDLLGKSG